MLDGREERVKVPVIRGGYLGREGGAGRGGGRVDSSSLVLDGL